MNTRNIIGYNYLGPYISDGKFQPSVAYGSRKPVDRLDANARLHDTAYANYSDYGHRTAADSLFAEFNQADASKTAKIANFAVLYGNKAIGALPSSKGNPLLNFLGAVVQGVKNQYLLYDYINHEDEYKNDIRKIYTEDKTWQHFNSLADGGGVKINNMNGFGVRSTTGNSTNKLNHEDKMRAFTSWSDLKKTKTPKETQKEKVLEMRRRERINDNPSCSVAEMDAAVASEELTKVDSSPPITAVEDGAGASATSVDSLTAFSTSETPTYNPYSEGSSGPNPYMYNYRRRGRRKRK